MRRRTQQQRGLSCIAFAAVTATACTQMTVQMVPVPQAVAEGGMSELQLTMRDGRVVQITRPTIVGDSVIGIDPANTARVAVNLADVRIVSKQTHRLEYPLLQPEQLRRWYGYAAIAALIVYVLLGGTGH
jgi:hypothetical protein